MKLSCLTLLAVTLSPLTLVADPTITQQPMSLTVLAGSSNSFSVQATGTPTLFYQWQLNGTNLTGSTNSSYSIPYAVATPLYQPTPTYDVLVSNSVGVVTSQVATLTVEVPAYIITQPQSQTVLPGSNATFSVIVTGTPPFSYQWYSNGISLGSAATGTNYTVTNAKFGSPSSFEVVVTNVTGSVTSQVAVLSVRDYSQPVISGSVGNGLLFQCTGPAGAVVNFPIFVSDIYDPAPSFTCTPPLGSMFPIGFTTVTCVATDHFGNTNTAYFQVEVEGQCDAGCIQLNVPADIHTNLTQAPTIPVYFTATAFSTCTGQPYPVVCTPPSGSAFPPGKTVVTCVASADGASITNVGSSVTKTFNVFVGVTNLPIVQTPGVINVCIPTGQTSVAVNYTVQVLDAAGVPVTVTAAPPSGSLFPLGNTIVNVTASDSYGNSTATSFPVIVGTSARVDPDWGFEDPCGLSGWTVTGFQGTNGTILNLQPVTGDLFKVGSGRFPALQAQMQGTIGGDYWNKIFHPVGHKGQRWLCTADNHVYGPPQQGNFNDLVQDTLMGSIVSVDFVITNDCISFLIGGGNDPNNLLVELLVKQAGGTIVIDGANYAVVDSATGNGQETMRRAWFSGLIKGLGLYGQHARIQIVDNSRVGHLNVDDFQFSDSAPPGQTVTIRPAELAYGGVQYPAVVTTDGVTYYDWDSAVWGFADLHTHPMSCLGFGQKLFHGWPDGAVFSPNNGATDFTNGLSNCNPDHGGWGLDNTSGDYWRNVVVDATDGGSDNPHNEGYDPQPLVEFRHWPVFNTITHQQMWYDWMRRAYNGGERVVVALCVNNELLNAVSKGAAGAPIDDASVGELEIQGMKDFVARHSDFMAIAYDPVQLRRIVRSNMLAIVLGSELDDFGNLCQDPGVTTNSPLSAYSKGAVANAIQHLYDEGLRYMFTVHLADNKFGGTGSETAMLDVASKFLNHGAPIEVTGASLSDDVQLWMDNLIPSQAQLDELTLFNSQQVANALAGASVNPAAVSVVSNALAQYQTAMQLSGALNGLTGMGAASGSGILPFLGTLIGANGCPNCLLDSVLNFLGIHDVTQFNNANLLPVGNNYPVYPACDQAPNGVRNVRGLSPLGVFAVQEMMKRGMMLDVDHMSETAVNDTFNIATNVPGGYPLNSGHNGYREMGVQNSENSRSINQLAILQPLGGLLGVGWEDSADGFWTTNFSDIVPTPQYSSSMIANDCAGTSKTWAQEYLYALEKFQGSNVTFGTDADGFIQFPGPRFGPESAYGLIQSDALCEVLLSNSFSKNVNLRGSQIESQNNGVLYTDNVLLTTPAFKGLATDYNQDPLNGSGSFSVNTVNGFQYTGEQADFFAAVNIYHYFQPLVSGGLTEDALKNILGQAQSALSQNYDIVGLGFNVGDNSHRRRIKELALGLLKGINGWGAEDDCLVGWVEPSQQLGIGVYDTVVNNNRPAALNEMFGYHGFCSSGGYWGSGGAEMQLDQLIAVWNDYQKAFGTNTPMTRCQTDFKEWDINFEGVAHYGLIPDFLQDLHNVGLQPQDMSPMFRSAEGFARMWTKSIAGSVAFGPPQFYFIGPDGHGHILISYTQGDSSYILQQNTNPLNPSGWVPATITATVSNPVTTTVAVPLSTCASCPEYYRLVSSP
ncbi:MAG TPA: HYR domain-containing protein [Verrucomicrobiae bacterium]|nr:HYR domain-containing protein [Verrucomicrobiae bacterium]